jgi:hypothetical protein
MPRKLDKASTEFLVERLLRIPEDQQPLWGTMTPVEMMSHCTTAVRMAFGDIPAKVRMAPWQAFLARLLFIDLFPFPKNSPTAPELNPRKKMKVSADFAAAQKELVDALHRINDAPDNHAFAMHPMFRKMNRQQWGKLMYKHMDHHLRQFGV